MPEKDRPLVSVVVAARDERPTIHACLRSLLSQTYEPLEVIVVDDGSRDGTGDTASAVPGVRVFRQEHLGAGTARNRGARESAGEILVFFDGDCVADPGFVEALVAPILETDAIGTFTKEIFVANPGRRWARAHQVGRWLPPDRHFPPGSPDEFEIYRAIRREDFLRVGGFDEVGYGEDVTVGRKLGRLAVAAPGAVIHHHEPDTLREILRTAVWYGRGARITEHPRPMEQYRPDRILRRAAGLAVRRRMPSLLVYRLVWDLGVVYGWRTRHRGSRKP